MSTSRRLNGLAVGPLALKPSRGGGLGRRGEVEAVNVLPPGQTCVRGGEGSGLWKMNVLEKLEEGVSNTDVGPCTPLSKTRRPSGPAWRVFRASAPRCCAFPRMETSRKWKLQLIFWV